MQHKRDLITRININRLALGWTWQKCAADQPTLEQCTVEGLRNVLRTELALYQAREESK